MLKNTDFWKLYLFLFILLAVRVHLHTSGLIQANDHDIYSCNFNSIQ